MRADYLDVLRETRLWLAWFTCRVLNSVLLDTVSGDVLIPLGWVRACVCMSHVQTLFERKTTHEVKLNFSW